MQPTESHDLSENIRHEPIALETAALGAAVGEAMAAARAHQIVFDTQINQQGALALRDIIGGLGNFRLWSMMGWLEIKQRYRRSTLGPFWLTASMSFMVVGLGLVYGLLFKQDIATYLPFVCLGMITWEFISKCITEGSTAFVLLEGVIKNIRLPLTTHVASTIWKNFVILGHNMLIYLVIMIVFGIRPGWTALWLVPGFTLVMLNLVWVALLMATICTRYRDVPLIVQSVVQMLFFVTPVFWSAELMPSRTVLVHGNPFFHMLELLRAPLLGREPNLESWIFMSVTLVLGWAGTLMLFTKFRRRVTYWL
jgi:ABC-type polysaccharide/polyol phosphate export permease